MLAVGLLTILLGTSCLGGTASPLPATKDHPVADLTILFFTASWCEPCHAVQAVLEKFARKHPKEVRLVPVDFDQCRDEDMRWQVREIPVVILLSNQGRILLRADGAERETLKNLPLALEDILKRVHDKESSP
jgi:thioredoxin-like negative regulator of GroEL